VKLPGADPQPLGGLLAVDEVGFVVHASSTLCRRNLDASTKTANRDFLASQKTLRNQESEKLVKHPALL
jgi:hypothetical protein